MVWLQDSATGDGIDSDDAASDDTQPAGYYTTTTTPG